MSKVICENKKKEPFCRFFFFFLKGFFCSLKSSKIDCTKKLCKYQLQICKDGKAVFCFVVFFEATEICSCFSDFLLHFFYCSQNR